MDSEKLSIWESDFGIHAVQLAAVQQLEAIGLTVPLGDPVIRQSKNEGLFKCAFGTSLFNQPTFSYQWKGRIFNLPRIFVVLVKFLECHVCDEGLFRKAGSVSRQKALRGLLECPHPSLPRDCNVHDVASIFKQFLRELPHPLLPAHYWPLLEGCVSLVPAEDQPRSLYLASLLLPSLNLQCLCVVMDLLSHISSDAAAGQSLMNAASLAVVMAPNLVQVSKNIVNLHDHSLRVQRRIVKLLIEGARELGLVPRDLEVAAGRSECSTRSLDNGCDDPLPTSPGEKDRKMTASSISGLLSGWSSKILRRRGVTGSVGVATEQPSSRKRAMKRSQQDTLERAGKRRALGGAEPGSNSTPGWWTLRRKGRGVAKSNESLHRSPLGSAGDDVICMGVASTDHTPDSSLTSSSASGHTPDSSLLTASSTSGHTPSPSHLIPPTPLLSNHLHSAKLRHSKAACSMPTIAPTSNTTLQRKGEESQDGSSGHAPLVSTPVSGCGSRSRDLLDATPTNGGRSHDLLDATPTVNGLFGTAVAQSPNLMTKICSEMARRSYRRHVLRGRSGGQVVQAGEERVKAGVGHVTSARVEGAIHGQERVKASESDVSHSLEKVNVAQVEPERISDSTGDGVERVNTSDGMSSDVGESGRGHGTLKRRRAAVADRSNSSRGRNRFGSCSHYSATLGIDLTDLPRRKLRKCEPMERDNLTEEPHPLLDCSQRRPSSPVVLSASLGITQLRGARHRERGKRAGLKVAPESCDVATPPPILKILEMNTKSKRTGVLENAPVSSDTTTDGGAEVQGKVDPLNTALPSVTNLPPASSELPKGQRSANPLRPLCLHDPLPHSQGSVKPLSEKPLPESVDPRPFTAEKPCSKPQQQQHKSPWRWASMRSRHDYTPVKTKGAISKRAQAYMVNLPRPSSCYAGFLKDGTTHQENLPPLPKKVKGQTSDISVEEWVL